MPIFTKPCFLEHLSQNAVEISECGLGTDPWILPALRFQLALVDLAIEARVGQSLVVSARLLARGVCRPADSFQE